MHGSATRRVATLAFILLVLAAVWYFVGKSSSDNSQLAEESRAAAVLKQEIVSLKARRNDMPSALNLGAEIDVPPEFESALRAELKGDEQFASNNYRAAQEAYTEALINLKQALQGLAAESAAPATSAASSDTDHASPVSSTPAVSRKLDEEIEAFTKSSLEKERKLLATAESQRISAQKASAIPAETPTSKTTSPGATATRAADDSVSPRAEADRALPSQKTKVAPQVASAATPETLSFVAPSGNSAVPFAKFEAAAAPDQNNMGSTTNASAAPPSPPSEETARREVATLLAAYQQSLSAKDIGGLKALFRENFLSSQEQAWADFFSQATNVHATVAGRSYRIAEGRGEVDLVITVQYANRKGVAQKALHFTERWTLERRNGNWSVAARSF